MDLADQIKCIYPEIIANDFFNGAIVLMDEGTGPFIKSWNYSKPQPTEKQLIDASKTSGPSLSVEDAKAVIQGVLDRTAIDLGYESILSATSYAGYDNPYQNQAQSLGVWRATVWKAAFAYFSSLNGKPMPSKADLLPMIPRYPQ